MLLLCVWLLLKSFPRFRLLGNEYLTISCKYSKIYIYSLNIPKYIHITPLKMKLFNQCNEKTLLLVKTQFLKILHTSKAGEI